MKIEGKKVYLTPVKATTKKQIPIKIDLSKSGMPSISDVVTLIQNMDPKIEKKTKQILESQTILKSRMPWKMKW